MIALKYSVLAFELETPACDDKALLVSFGLQSSFWPSGPYWLMGYHVAHKLVVRTDLDLGVIVCFDYIVSLDSVSGNTLIIIVDDLFS